MDSPEQSIILMDPACYKAAAQGNLDPFEDHETPLNQLSTPTKDTILHVYLENQTKEPEFTDFVDRILHMCPPLLMKVNVKGETPLHFAARYGHANVVEVLIDRAEPLPVDPESGLTGAEKIMRMTNVEGDTALHVAARNGRSNVVEILTTEDPDFSYSANNRGETPLYIAACVRSLAVTRKILTNCSSVDYGGPYGRTALHAAIMAKDIRIARKILAAERNLTKTTDQKGWSPLHYAAYFRWNTLIVKLLLKYDVSAAYFTDIDRNRAAIHIAAIRGNLITMKKIVSCCPACCKLVDNRGWNALHYAVASKRVRVFLGSLKIPELGRLKTEKDGKGNTPYHLIAALAVEHKHWKIFRNFENRICGLNKQNLSVQDILQGNFGEIQQKEILESIEDVGSGPFGRIVVEKEKRASSKDPEKQKSLDKASEAHLVVAALIATVTFAAAFTLPGGLNNDKDDPNKGTAILSKNTYFKVFVISDAIAMVLSISAVYTHYWMAWTLVGGVKDRNKLLWFGSLLTMYAIRSMVVAFVSGICAVLETSKELVTVTVFIGMSFFFFMMIPHSMTTSRTRSFSTIIYGIKIVIHKIFPRSLSSLILLSV